MNVDGDEDSEESDVELLGNVDYRPLHASELEISHMLLDDLHSTLITVLFPTVRASSMSVFAFVFFFICFLVFSWKKLKDEMAPRAWTKLKEI